MKLRTSANKNNRNFNFARLIFAICFVFIIISPVIAFAKTLQQYRESVRYARDLTITMLYPDEEDATTKSSQLSESEILTKIRKSVPASEKIEWQGTSVETNNGWLKENLDEFEREPQASPKRRVILIAIGERLDALDQKLEELENPPAQNRAKDEDKQKLAEILRREEYQKPEKNEESLFQKAYRKIMEWLASFFPRPDFPSASLNGFGSFSFVLQMLLYALVFGVIGFLIYKFAPFVSERFRRKIQKEKTERVILGERISAEETAQNLFAEAERLAGQGNLRGAIRKGYIALLCELADRKVVGLSRHKTNRDYLRDVRGKGELYQNMNGLTSNFERHWYGFESAEEKDWEEFRNGYKEVIKN
jgi:uncharacterized protein YlbG (UPF0298 family)